MVTAGMTPRDAVRQLEARLTAAGCPDADYDAAELFRLVTGRDVRLADAPLTEAQAARLESLCLRREAREAVRALHESGFANVVMMTGDNRRTAEAVAAEVGVDAVYAEVLPEDKAAFIRQEKEKGHTVIMVGDGVNDSPALSEADAGIAISTGAAIAREIADITVASEGLLALVTLRRLGEALMERIHGSYRFIVGFNLALIALGVAGVLPPTTSALLHNGSTLGISLRNMTDLLDDEENTQK